MNIRKISIAILAAGLFLSLAPTYTFAGAGPSGPITHKGKGKIGAVYMNPYGIAPLTAVIMSGGYNLSDVSVVVKGRGDKGIDISYKVSDGKVKLHGGIPIFGMYPDYQNIVEVSYKKHMPGGEGAKTEDISETYTIYAPPTMTYGSGTGQKRALPKAEVVIPAAKELRGNLYLMNYLSSILPNASQAVWNLPAGGALEWDYEPYVWMIDTNGDIRWFLDVSKLRDTYDLRKKGNLMGFDQTVDGALICGMGQAYMKYDLMGRQIFHRALPKSYNDFSHHMEETSKGTYLLRVASADMKRKDGKNVRTVRDVLIELDRDGNVIDEWNMGEILDPYRDVNLLAMDQGAVCLNIDVEKAGKTASKEEMEENAPFGDIAGVGSGRNWAHINSVNYDSSDDSIILSVRNQSAVVKVGRDKKIKWILGSPEGWSGKFAKKVLTPVDKDGKRINCGESGSKCPGYLSEKGGFDWPWVQHTAYKINEKSKPGIVHVSVFDNGDSRGMEQPAIISMKYSRAVEYVVNEKDMTVQQVWEFGKERGFKWYSPITSVVEYQPKTDSMMIHSATAGMGDVQAVLQGRVEVEPFLHEIKYGTNESMLEIKITDNNFVGYRALSIDLQKAFK